MPTTYAIPDGRTVMAATTWTGTNAIRSISNAVNGVSFQPDFVWIKDRSRASSHDLVDSVRGVNLALISDATTAQYTGSFVSSFNSNGFGLPANTTSDNFYTNISGDSFVGWQWKAGGTAVTNTAGSITSSVSANTTAGFSVVTYTGNETNSTVGHGLGVAPSMIIGKLSNYVEGWYVWHSAFAGTEFIQLNTTGAKGTSASLWNSTIPTSSVFSLGTSASMNRSGINAVMYCFAPVAGYSVFGSYTGNGSTDGPFIYTSMRPRFLLIRSTSNLREWFLVDTSRNSFNVANSPIRANTSAAEGSDTITDIVSNGFKLRSSDTAFNASGETYIYAAFAENPFKYANAR